MIETQALRMYWAYFPVAEVLNFEQKIGKNANDAFRPSSAEREFLTNPKISLGNKHKVTQSKVDSLNRTFS